MVVKLNPSKRQRRNRRRANHAKFSHGKSYPMGYYRLVAAAVAQRDWESDVARRFGILLLASR